MAFGQQSGPPATHRQVQQLTSLINAAGHTDFRDARGPLGLTQRQAGGKFTRDEADDLIARLEAEAEAEAEAEGHGDLGAGGGGDVAGAADGAGVPAPRTRLPPVDRREAERVSVLRKMPADLLAAELQRRGWIVMEP